MTNYPATLQDLDATRGSATSKLDSPSHSAHHALEDDTLEALQAKVGVDSSAVVTSIDYILKNVTGGHDHDGLNSKKVLFTNLDVTGLTASQLIRLNAGGTALESSGKVVPTGDIVGTSDSQVLTNKTLTSPVLNTGVSGTAVDTDGTLAANSDTILASQKATKTYVNSQATAVLTLTNKRINKRADNQTSTATITPEISTYDLFIRGAQAEALVINNHSTSTPAEGEMMLFKILSDATPRAITYGNKYVAKAGVPLPTTTVASKTLWMLFIYMADQAQWCLLASGQEA